MSLRASIVCSSDHPDHAGRCGLDDRNPEPSRNRFVGRAGEVDVDLAGGRRGSSPDRECRRSTERSVMVGSRPAASVAGRSRIGSGRDWDRRAGRRHHRTRRYCRRRLRSRRCRQLALSPGNQKSVGVASEPVVGRDLDFAVFDQRALCRLGRDGDRGGDPEASRAS